MPNSQKRIASPNQQSRTSNRLGIIFFSAYAALYGLFVYAFVVRAATEPDGATGTNTAITYGVILIVVSFALAILYSALNGKGSSTKSDRTQ